MWEPRRLSTRPPVGIGRRGGSSFKKEPVLKPHRGSGPWQSQWRDQKGGQKNCQKSGRELGVGRELYHRFLFVWWAHVCHQPAVSHDPGPPPHISTHPTNHLQPKELITPGFPVRVVAAKGGGVVWVSFSGTPIPNPKDFTGTRVDTPQSEGKGGGSWGHRLPFACFLFKPTSAYKGSRGPGKRGWSDPLST